MRRVALKGLWLRRGRSLLTTLAVVLGVAMVCGTYILTDTISAAFKGIFETGNANTSAIVSAKELVKDSTSGKATVPAALLAKIQATPGVAEASGSISTEGFGTDSVRLISDSGKAIGSSNSPRFGFGLDFNTRFNPFVLTAGRFPTGDGELAIDRNTADKEHLKPGDRIQIAAQGPKQRFTITGVARFGSVNSLGGATMALFTTPVAQQLLDKTGQFNQISVAADPGIDDAALADRLKPVVGAGFVVRTGQQQAKADAKDIDEATAFIRYFLLAFGFIALGVGSFVIYNTLTITIAQRVRELATLRALGASAKQVRRSVLIEGLALGILASLIGLVCGYGLAVLLSAVFDALGIDLPKTDEVVKGRTIFASLAIGIIVTAIASISPARRATRISPVAAMLEGARLDPKLSVRRPVVGITVTAVAAVLLGIGAFAGLGVGLAMLFLGIGTLFLFTGVAMLANRTVLPLASFFGTPVKRFGGAAGRLARENTARNPARTASTAGALMIALALVTLVATLGEGLHESDRGALEDAVTTKTTSVITHKNGFDTIPAAVDKAAAKVPGAQVYPVRHDRANVFGKSVSVDGLPAGIDSVVNIRTRGGSLVPPADGAVVEAGYARDHHLVVGSPITVLTPARKTLHLRVSALQVRTSVQKIDPLFAKVIVAESTFDGAFQRPGDAYVFVSGNATVTQLREAVKGFPDIKTNTRAAWITERLKGINILLNLLYVLLALSVIVSLFGMVNTLVLTVFERTREIGMLRAVGMSRRQVRRMVRQEAVITSLIGAALGLPLGILLARLLSSALADQGIGFAIPGTLLIVFTIVAVLAGIVAAIAPARRAARLDVLKALQFE
jgi:putative ABC transport system permease protein